MHIELAVIVVDDYADGIRFFRDILGFDVVDDSPSLTNDGRTERWVAVRPQAPPLEFLLARADGPAQAAVVGTQVARTGRVFLRVDDFDDAYARMLAGGVEFVSAPRDERYGRVAVLCDISGNRWDLLGPLGNLAHG
jgi:catechol 2,3-dioxygenase-like lactoylglutathione lyase family enzyme